jgi:hypothetical protein
LAPGESLDSQGCPQIGDTQCAILVAAMRLVKVTTSLTRGAVD